MGTKSCKKVFNFSTKFSCKNLAVEDRFRNARYGEKILMWEMFCLGMVSTNLYTWYALLCGGYTKFKLPKAGNGKVFFLTRVKFARADKAVALQYHY